MKKLEAFKTVIGEYRALDENNIGHNFKVYYGNVLTPFINNEIKHMPLLFIFNNIEYQNREECYNKVNEYLGHIATADEIKKLVIEKDTYLELLENFLNEPENEDYQIPTTNEIKDAIQYCKNIEISINKNINLNEIESTVELNKMINASLDEKEKQDVTEEINDNTTVDNPTETETTIDLPANEEKVLIDNSDVNSSNPNDNTQISAEKIPNETSNPNNNSNVIASNEEQNNDPITNNNSNDTTDVNSTKDLNSEQKQELNDTTSVKQDGKVDLVIVEKITDLTRRATTLEQQNKKSKLMGIIIMLLLIISMAVNGLFIYRYFDSPYPNGYTQIDINGTTYKVPIANIEVQNGQKKILIYGFTTTNENGEIKNVAIPLGEFDLQN